MLALLLALQAIDPLVTSTDGYPLGALADGRVAMKGCTALLWLRTPSKALIATAMTDPATIRLAIDGKPATLAISAQNGIGASGFSQTTEYKSGGVTATLDLALKKGPGGVSVGDSTLRIERADKPAVTVPIDGMISCA